MEHATTMKKAERTAALVLAGTVALLGSACSDRAAEDKAKAAVAASAASVAVAAAPTVEQLEAAVPDNPLKEAYFGETHVHTSYSLDGYIGGARLTPDDAYKFAQGGDVVVNGQKHNIGRPLDWVAVSDHAEFIGEMYSTQVPGAKGGDNPMLEELRNLKSVDEQRAWFVKYVVSNNRGDNPTHPPFYAGPETTRSAWHDVILKAARDHYQPGRFTTLAEELFGPMADWIRDDALKNGANWFVEIPAGTGDVKLKMTVLATEKASGGRGTSAVFYLTWGQAGGAQAGQGGVR